MANSSIDFVYFDPAIWGEEQLLPILAKCSSLMLEGATIMEWASEGSDGKREFVAPIPAIMKGVQRCLKQVNPKVYGSIVRGATMVRLA